MTQRQSFGTLLLAALVALGIIGSATVLVALGDLDSAAYATLVGSALTATGIGGIQLGNKAINGGPVVDLERMAKISESVAQTIANSAPPPASPTAAPPSGEHGDTGATG